MNANKNVLNGIEYVAGAMHNGKFRVVYDDCPQFRKEIYNYAWNEKTGDVIKKDDDCMDSMRYACITTIWPLRRKHVSWRAG